MPKRLLGYLLICLIVISGPLRAERSDTRFRRISLAQGLSQCMAKAMIQDSKGFVWIGTQDGLNKYDGYQFTVYRPDPANAHSISHNEIVSLLEDKEGYIWVGTFRGLNRFDRNTGRFTSFRFKANTPGALSHDSVTCLRQTRDGKIWVGTMSGLNRFDAQTGTFTVFRKQKNIPGSLAGDIIISLYEDRTGDLWVGTNQGLSRMPERQKGIFTNYQSHLGDLGGLTDDNIMALLEDHSGEFWVGTSGGLHRMNRKTGVFTVYQSNPHVKGQISSNIISCIFEDHSGVLWVGTLSEGLNRLDRRSETFTHIRHDPRDPRSLSDNQILSMFEDKSGALWVGTNGGGVSRCDRLADNFKSYSYDPNNPNSLSSPYVFGICEDRQGYLWVGTSTAGLNRISQATGENKIYRANPAVPGSLASDMILHLFADSDDDVWISTSSGLNLYNRETDNFTVYRHDPLNPESLSSNLAYMAIQDSRGAFWVGTVDSGLNRLDKKTGKCKPYRHKPGDSNSLNDDCIRALAEDSSGHIWIGTSMGLNRLDPTTGEFIRFDSGKDQRSPSADVIMWIHQDKQGYLWLATFGGGLNRFDPRSGLFTYYREKEGLPNNVVYIVEPDDKGFLWISTNSGISRFDPRSGKFRNYTIDDGLQSNEFNSNAFGRGRDGLLYFGGSNGVNYFDPERFSENSFAPPVVITGFQIFNIPAEIGTNSPLTRCIGETRTITLAHWQNVFSFEFVALNYTIPEKNRFRYKLEGFDRDWVNVGSSKRFASYTNIDPGEYTFRVLAANNDGVWNKEGARVKIIIKPPYWKTWWFRGLVFFLLAGLAFLGYRRRMNFLMREMRMEAELQTARDAQMSIMPQKDPRLPHFEVSGVCVPAFEVGGDFFDYLWMDHQHRKFVIAIGDVSGKAMKAAMTAVMSSGMLYSKIYGSDSVKDVMTEMNNPLYEKIDRRMFTALCLAALDISEKEFVFVNAGLNEPLLKSGEQVTPLESTGPRLPLGAAPNNRYQETSIQLKTGDVLVLYTDGITEAMNSEESFYGCGALRNLLLRMDTLALTAAQIKFAILDDVRKFAGNTPQHDDMTVVVIKLNS